jgi:DNA-binding MarR family transcriptional regulator
VSWEEHPCGSRLPTQLEQTFRLLGKRIYLPSVRQLRRRTPGLDQAGLPLLAALEDHDDLRPSDVAVAVELDLSTVSRQLRQLERLGLVSCQPDAQDGRARRFSLTDAGRAGLAAVRADRADRLNTVFGQGWSQEEREQLQTLLDRLLTGLAALPDGSTPANPTSPDAHPARPNREAH